MNTKIVILDRDGAINHDSDDYVKSPEEWEPLPGAIDAMAKLHHAGWHMVIASNQSGLGRGLFDVATLNQMHDKLHKALAAVGARVDAVFIAPTRPMTTATAASLCLVYSNKLASGLGCS